jgi:hypothetical protein
MSPLDQTLQAMTTLFSRLPCPGKGYPIFPKLIAGRPRDLEGIDDVLFNQGQLDEKQCPPRLGAGAWRLSFDLDPLVHSFRSTPESGCGGVSEDFRSKTCWENVVAGL